MTTANKRLTRRQKRQHTVETDHILNTKFAMKRIEPITENQRKMKAAYLNGDSIVNIGSAGTGKTYLTLALALNQVLTDDNFKKIIIIRSAVQSRDQGFMPGSLTEKMGYYETPYIDIVNNLFGRPDAYSIMKQKGMIEFMSTSFIRGLTFDNAIVIFDECQNAQYEECRTIITRIGESSKLILCGDTKQDDLRNRANRSDRSGLPDFLKVIEQMKGFSVINFTTADIVRGGIVKEFIIKEEKVLEYA